MLLFPLISHLSVLGSCVFVLGMMYCCNPIRTNNCIVIFLVMSALPGHFASYNLLVSGWTLDKHAWSFHDAECFFFNNK